MDYRKYGDAWYIRMDRGDEMVACLLELCRREGIAAATYSGIGGCSSAELQVFNPERGDFDSLRLEGMLELVSFMGNVFSDENGALHSHTHALFACNREGVYSTLGGHLKATTVLYTAELELRPVTGGTIGARHDPETGTAFWAFED